MAALQHDAAAALHRRRLMPENISLVKPTFFISSFSTSSPTKHARRRNHLRQKILKTLKNPLIPKLPPSNPINPIEIDVNQETQEFKKRENSELARGAESQELLKEVEVCVPAGVGVDGKIGVAGQNSFLKYGMWFVGAFLFQTVCAIIIFGLNEINDDGSGEFRAKDVVLDENGKMGLTGDGYINADNLEMELKIKEIRFIAREVRERERLQSNGNNENREEDEAKNKDGRPRIARDGRLFMSRKLTEVKPRGTSQPFN